MTIKSQDDLHKPETHSIEVLLATISKLETTTKELEKIILIGGWIIAAAQAIVNAM